MQQECDISRNVRLDALAGGLRENGDMWRVAGHCCCLFPRHEIIDDRPVSFCPECKRKSGGDRARAARGALADWV